MLWHHTTEKTNTTTTISMDRHFPFLSSFSTPQYRKNHNGKGIINHATNTFLIKQTDGTH